MDWTSFALGFAACVVTILALFGVLLILSEWAKAAAKTQRRQTPREVLEKPGGKWPPPSSNSRMKSREWKTVPYWRFGEK